MRDRGKEGRRKGGGREGGKEGRRKGKREGGRGLEIVNGGDRKGLEKEKMMKEEK